MAAVLLDGRALAADIRAAVAEEAAALGGVCLATILVGDDPASQLYIAAKHRAAAEAGIETRDHRLPAGVSESHVLDLVEMLNSDDSVDGLLVQLPLPAGVDGTRVTHAVQPVKDVDGFHPLNAGHLALGTPLHVSATPLGCMALLGAAGVDPAGKGAVVVGRSVIVGKPMASLLVQANATVTICHSRTTDLGHHVRNAEIVVAAAGRPGLITAAMVRPGAVVLDVGMNRTDAGLVGDVDPDVADVAAFLTPVPGGVGPMTIAMLLQSTVKAARFRRGILAFADV
jgi:methylenetetrahydrofolate dehydrogenase (NADP+) / methenyltetrahydrofolate cyclohydrolase